MYAAHALEKAFCATSQALNVRPCYHVHMEALLGKLKRKSPMHYEHSLRVGLLAQRIATQLGLDPKALFMAGVLHDVGKCMIPKRILHKTGTWTTRDAEIMQAHVMIGYQMTKDIFFLSADTLSGHHYFQDNGYPKELPALRSNYTVDVMTHRRIVALADVYDALHRTDCKHGRVLSGYEIKQQMFVLNPDITALVHNLYVAGIFTT